MLDNCEHLRKPVATSPASCSEAAPACACSPPAGRPWACPGKSTTRCRRSGLLGPIPTRPSSLVGCRPALPDEGPGCATPPADDAAAVATAARICRDLDGLPLAIELAAARAKALSLDEIATRLGDRFQFLVSWRRMSTARHRTLRAAMDWSYDLLSDAEQALLDRLSVFAGGFNVTTAAAICLDGDEGRAVDLIGRLVDASLVGVDERAGRTRYRLLETVRQYADEQLDARGEASAVRRWHADAFAALADEAWAGLREAEGTAIWMERLGDDNDNLRAAMAWAREADQPRHLLRLAGGLWWFWWLRGDFSEGRTWLGIALEHGGSAEPALRARAMEGAAGLAWAQGDLVSATDLAATARPLFAALEDRRGEATCTNILGLVANARQDYRAAEAMFERTIALAEASASEDGANSGSPMPTTTLVRLRWTRAMWARRGTVRCCARALSRAGRPRGHCARRVQPRPGRRRGCALRRCRQAPRRSRASLSGGGVPLLHRRVPRRDRGGRPVAGQVG